MGQFAPLVYGILNLTENNINHKQKEKLELMVYHKPMIQNLLLLVLMIKFCTSFQNISQCHITSIMDFRDSPGAGGNLASQ